MFFDFDEMFGAYATHTDNIEAIINHIVRDVRCGVDVSEPYYLEGVVNQHHLTPSMISSTELDYINKEVNRRA